MSVTQLVTHCQLHALLLRSQQLKLALKVCVPRKLQPRYRRHQCRRRLRPLLLLRQSVVAAAAAAVFSMVLHCSSGGSAGGFAASPGRLVALLALHRACGRCRAAAASALPRGRRQAQTQQWRRQLLSMSQNLGCSTAAAAVWPLLEVVLTTVKWVLQQQIMMMAVYQLHLQVACDAAAASHLCRLWWQLGSSSSSSPCSR